MPEIIIRIIVPEGASVHVTNGAEIKHAEGVRHVVPGPAQSWTEPLDEAPWPSETPASAPTMPVAAMEASGLCPRHHVPWKVVPAGISKKTGNPYKSFTACPEMDCNERPR